MANDNPQPGDLWTQLVQMPVALSPAEKTLRDSFVTQYLIDRDPFAAAVRVGFMKNVAGQYAQDLLWDPYVQKKITEYDHADEAVSDDEAQRKVRQKRIKAGLMREAHYHGPGASHGGRVTALVNLAKLEKMEVDGDADQEEDKETSLIKAFKEFAVKAPV